jgi:hypothetical protein
VSCSAKLILLIVQIPSDHSRVLLTLESNRFFLRAYHELGHAEHHWYLDYVPHIAQIAKLSEDIFTMPEIPAQVKQKTGEKHFVCVKLINLFLNFLGRLWSWRKF